MLDLNIESLHSLYEILVEDGSFSNNTVKNILLKIIQASGYIKKQKYEEAGCLLFEVLMATKHSSSFYIIQKWFKYCCTNCDLFDIQNLKLRACKNIIELRSAPTRDNTYRVSYACNKALLVYHLTMPPDTLSKKLLQHSSRVIKFPFRRLPIEIVTIILSFLDRSELDEISTSAELDVLIFFNSCSTNDLKNLLDSNDYPIYRKEHCISPTLCSDELNYLSQLLQKANESNINNIITYDGPFYGHTILTAILRHNLENLYQTLKNKINVINHMDFDKKDKHNNPPIFYAFLHSSNYLFTNICDKIKNSSPTLANSALFQFFVSAALIYLEKLESKKNLKSYQQARLEKAFFYKGKFKKNFPVIPNNINVSPHIQILFTYHMYNKSYKESVWIKAVIKKDNFIPTNLFSYAPNADPSSKNKRGNTAIHFACGQGKLDFLQLMIFHIKKYFCTVNNFSQEIARRINKQNNVGDTPLHCAASNGNKKIVTLLLKYGGDKNIKNNNNETAYDVLKQREGKITHSFFICKKQIFHGSRKNNIKKIENLLN